MSRNAYGERATASNHDAPIDPPDVEASVLDTTPGDVLLPVLLDYIGQEIGYQAHDKLLAYVERRVKGGAA